MLRNLVALVCYHALLSNAQRYRYIERLAKQGKHTNEELTNKNINKAYKLADQFMSFNKNRKP